MPDGRPKPLSLVKGHRTNAEKELRANAEKSMYTGESFRESDEVKSDPRAHKEFLRLKRLFSQLEHIDGLDEAIINRYCLETASFFRLKGIMADIVAEIAITDEFEKKMSLYDLLNRNMNAEHKTKELLLKFEDRLFLSPAARIKAIPKKIDTQEKESDITRFRQKRADVK